MHKRAWQIAQYCGVAITVAYLGFFIVGWHKQSFPITFANVTSPDGSWSVLLKKEWKGGNVVVWAEAFDEKGRLLGKHVLDKLEHWDEPELRFSEVRCSNTGVSCGNRSYDGDEGSVTGGPQVIAKSAFVARRK